MEYSQLDSWNRNFEESISFPSDWIRDLPIELKHAWWTIPISKRNIPPTVLPLSLGGTFKLDASVSHVYAVRIKLSIEKATLFTNSFSFPPTHFYLSHTRSNTCHHDSVNSTKCWLSAVVFFCVPQVSWLARIEYKRKGRIEIAFPELSSTSEIPFGELFLF